MSFKNYSIYNKLQKIDENNKIKTENEQPITNENIISLNEIMNATENVSKKEKEIDLMVAPKSAMLTSVPRSLLLEPNKLAKLSIYYDNVSTNITNKSI